MIMSSIFIQILFGGLILILVSGIFILGYIQSEFNSEPQKIVVKKVIPFYKNEKIDKWFQKNYKSMNINLYKIRTLEGDGGIEYLITKENFDHVIGEDLFHEIKVIRIIELVCIDVSVHAGLNL